MQKIKINFKKISEHAKQPTAGTVRSSGFDLYASESMVIYPGAMGVVPTGIVVEPQLHSGVAEDFVLELQIRPRSGLAAKHQITVQNSPGTIDEDYRGEIKVLLRNEGKLEFTVSRGDRIAQIIPNLVPVVDWYEVDELSDTERGEGGFGSTGI